MPRFELGGNQYDNPVELALDIIGGKLKNAHPLAPSPARMALRRAPPQAGTISTKMLTQQLRELERDGLLTR